MNEFEKDLLSAVEDSIDAMGDCIASVGSVTKSNGEIADWWFEMVSAQCKLSIALAHYKKYKASIS